MAARFFCSVAAQERADQLIGTTTRLDRWLLVEQSGPWGPQSLPESRLDAHVANRLAAAIRAQNGRMLLIRRTDGSACARRHVYVADCRPGHESLWLRTVADDAELPELRLPDVDVSGWSEVEGPLLLACTQGRHDVCCAVRGRPVAKALEAAAERAWAGQSDVVRVWECSHTGGDRFAANVLVLPHGLGYGWVDAEDAERMVTAARGERVVPELLRGRCSYAGPVQAAQHYARSAARAAGEVLDGLGDLLPTAATVAAPEVFDVTLSSGWQVRVRRELASEPARLTCHAPTDKVAPIFRLLSLTHDPS